MFVVDASVWVSYYWPSDVNHLASRPWLDNQIVNKVLLFAPNIVLAEVAGPLARRTGQTVKGQLARAEMASVPFLQLLEIDQALANQAADLAATLRLKGADAIYVAVAQQLGIPLVTWDKDVIAKATGTIQAQTP